MTARSGLSREFGARSRLILRPGSVALLAFALVALGGAAETGKVPDATPDSGLSEPWATRSVHLRESIRASLKLPLEKPPLQPLVREVDKADMYRVEAVSYESEAGSRVSASLYLPVGIGHPAPAVVVACGHGGSKSGLYAQYAGQLYATFGFVCLVPDTIGEEERDASGLPGARGHDMLHLGNQTDDFVQSRLKRPVLGKIAWDLTRGIDYLQTRREVDASRIGIMGYSLGGASAGIVTCIDQRISAAVLCGWIFSPRFAEAGKNCTARPYLEFKKRMSFAEMTALPAPHAATLFICGANDDVIDKIRGGANNVDDLTAIIPAARRVLEGSGLRGEIRHEIVPEAGHRPFFLAESAVAFFQEKLMSAVERRTIHPKRVLFGAWADSQGQPIESLYNTERRERGLAVVECGAVYRTPRQLACNPGREIPDPAYTMQGWVFATVRANHPEELERWLAPQHWRRDQDTPVLSLGSPGTFDDTHVSNPCVIFENGVYTMWYSGAAGSVADRVSRLGIARSTDGIQFVKGVESPVHDFGDAKTSICTPCVLRNPDGSVLRMNGQLVMWFAAQNKSASTGNNTLHSTVSADGITWSDPSPPLLGNLYAPTVLKEGDTYRMWYSDVTSDPWVVRHAFSRDGVSWKVSPNFALTVDQPWEQKRLFYPTVLKVDGWYVMWYGAYWSADKSNNKTAIGCAVSADGLHWVKNPSNPVLMPDPAHEWESHYTTSQSVLRLPDGSFRIWYASRKAPPFVNKYFAVGTALWNR